MVVEVHTSSASRVRALNVLATALTLGVIAAPGFAHAGNAEARGQAQPAKKLDKQVAAAERDVARQPTSAAARARLGQTYLGAGRFVSASAAFEDAVALGDQSGATALGMALSYIGTGRDAEAASLLGQWRDTIPASDHGLALALAGQPAEAIQILSGIIKQGENTPKVRQNLAYSYALAGYLPQARVIAAQDVPLDQLDARISEWALQASVGNSQSRIAALLGAPVRSDPGLPVQLALAQGAPALARAQVPAPIQASAQMQAASIAEPQADQLSGDELPALAEPAPMPVAADPAPMLAEAEPAPPAPEPAAPAMMAQADGATPAQASSRIRFVSNPVVQDISNYVPATQMAHAVASTPSPALARTSVAARASAKSPPARKPATGTTHLVQLGSFTTEEGAHRAWRIFQRRDPRLKDHELRITKAMVNGRTYFRVAAAGFDAGSARAHCSSAARECFAYAARRELPGALGAVSRRLASRD